MAEERKDLPAATSDNFAARARETLMTYLGRQGDPLDRGITLRDLIDGGLIAVREGFSLGGRGKLPIQPAPSLGGGGGTDEEKDLTPPPTPTGLAVSAGITNLIIEHDAPLYSQGHGHARTLVYGAKGGTGTPPVFADAVKIHEFTGTVSAYVTEPATTWHLWIKWVSVDGVASSLPGGGINGEAATTGQDPAKVLQMLTGQIRETQLYADLGERIDLIDGNGTGSVNARIETETTARNAAESSLAQQITTVQAVLTQSNLGKPLPLWNLNGQSIVMLTDGKVGSAALRLSGSAGHYPNQGYLVPIDRSKQYRTRFWARPSADADGSLYFSLRQYLNESGAPGPVNGGRSPYKPSGISKSLHDTTYGSGQWGEYSFVWSSSDWQAGVAFVSPEFLDNYSGAAGYWDVQDFTFTEVTAIENLSASVQTEATARANADGTLFAQYTVKIDNNGYVSGFGLASSANNAAPESTFAVRADTFYIASPTGPGVTPALPFIVKTTAGAWGPAGVYIQEALIANATIGSAKIADAAIDDAKVANLSAAKLTAGDGTIGGLLKSSNYVVGSAGWMIHPNGTAEFAAAAIRGQLVASQIDSRGLSIKDASGNVILAAGSALPPAYLPADARKNLANIDWWKEGASIPWVLNGELNQIRHTSQVPGAPTGPRGVADVVWYCEETSGDSMQGGGWHVASFDSALDKNKCYRFVVPIYRVSGSGASYWGIESVATLNTDTTASNPYFCDRSLPVGKWFLFVGFVYPAGTSNATNAGSGIYDCETGALVDGGTSYNFLSSGTSEIRHRAYQFYATANASQIFGRPLVECVDGTESSLREYFSASATLNSAISMGADGTLTGGAGGKVTLPGMGYVGALDATKGATIGTDLVGQFTPANSSTYIADAAIKSAHIENLAVNSAKIDDLAVTAAKIADLAVTSAKIGDASINSAKIGNLAVDSIHIIGEAVTTSRFGSANGYQRWWSGFNHIYSTYEIEDIYSTLYVPVRSGEQTLITVSYVETMSGDYSYTDYDGVNSYPTVISREPRIRVNGALLPTISGIHGCVRALYFADSTNTIQIDFAVWVKGTQDGYYRAGKLIMSAFTARR